MLIACTTVTDRRDAEKLATAAIEHHLAVCVQIDGPITSVYRWESRIEHSEEFRLMFKLLPGEVDNLGEKYLSWAMATSISSPL